MPIELMIFLAIPVLIIWVSRYMFPHQISYKEMGIQFAVISIVVTITFFAGTGSLSHDTEILNGYIVSKDRIHDTYEDPYDCNCSTDSDGNKSCMTCYETRYTVEWLAKSSVGGFQFKKLDKSFRSVYNEPNPKNYVNCKIGEPASREHSYDNWIKAVPDTLFSSTSFDPQYVSKIPSYPRVYGHYKLNRVINVDSKITTAEINKLNFSISSYLKTLGKTKEVNVIVVLTEIDQQEYRYSLESKWLGGKKNDVIVIIGLDDHKFTWVDTITFALNAGNEHFQVNMRDNLMTLGEFDVDGISAITQKTILDYFDREFMVKYEEIKEDIEPPTWALVLMFIFSVFGSLGLSYYFYRNEV